MLLVVGAALVALGIIVWSLGHSLSFTGIAVIGAVFILGAGIMATTGGIQYATGETVDAETIETTIPLEDIGEAIHVQTKDVSAQDSSPSGVDFNSDGDKMYVSGASTASVYSYNSGDHDLSIATFENQFNVGGKDSTPVGVEFQPDGTTMYVVGDSTDAIYQYTLSTPYNITSASAAGNLTLTGQTSAPRGSDFNDDGTILYIVASDSGDIFSYTLSTPYDVTTASLSNTFDVSSQEGTPTAIDFSADGTRMLLVGENQDVIFQYSLDTSYDISTAEYTGNRLDVSGQAQQASGIAYEEGGEKIFISDRQGSTVEQYDSSATSANTVTTKSTTYEDVNTPHRFSIGLLLTLLGATMMSQTLQERAS